MKLSLLKFSRQGLLSACLAAFAAVLLHGLTLKVAHPDVEDASQYVAAAYNMATSGVFSQAITPDPMPGLGREPGYSAVLAVLFRVIPPFGTDGISCLHQPDGCGANRYVAALWLNAVFIGLSGLIAFAAAYRLTQKTWAGWIAGGYLWLNFEAAQNKNALISDWLAVVLVATVSLALILAWQKRHWATWGLAGLSMAALVLTKTVFLPLAGLLIAAGAMATLWAGLQKHRTPATVILAFVLFATATAVPIGAWMARNKAVGGTFSITSGRTAVALSAREILNDMTPTQMAAGFVFWTRGFGDSLAASLWPKEVWAPLRYEAPNGFYTEGHARPVAEITALSKQKNLTPAEAESKIVEKYKKAILSRPLRHMATSVVLFWRGLWSDEFIVIGLPALFWALGYGLRHRHTGILLALMPGLYSLVFYPMISINVPRYQLTALPALGIATAIAAVAVATKWRRHKTPEKSPRVLE